MLQEKYFAASEYETNILLLLNMKQIHEKEL